MTLAALEATLRLYRDERQAVAQIPTLRMIAMPLTLLEERARQLASLIREADDHDRLQVQVQPGFSQVGGGALPIQNLSTWTVAVGSAHLSTQAIETLLRANHPPIIGRIETDRYLMDVRTLQPAEFPVIQQAFQRILSTVPQNKVTVAPRFHSHEPP